MPARLDRLPFARWHWLVVFALGAVWILDGLEVTIVGAISGQLEKTSRRCALASQLGLAGSIYVAGAVCRSAGVRVPDRPLRPQEAVHDHPRSVRRRDHEHRLHVQFLDVRLARFFTGAGIGGEYSAINSAIDELIPARVRGWTDLAING